MNFDATLPGSQEATQPPEIVIEPTSGFAALNLGEVISHGELILFLAWRDISVRYKQTILGASWAILQPVMIMVVFSIFFGKFTHLRTEGMPYPIFSYAGLLPWQYFANAVNNGSNCLVNNKSLVSKVFFPRLVVPISTLLPGLVDLAIASVVLILMMFYYHVGLSWRLLLIPPLIGLAVLAALGPVLWLSALSVYYRDFRYIMPFMVQILMFTSPVAYAIVQVPEKWRLLYSLNPLVGVIEGFRWALLGTHVDLVLPLTFSFGISLLLVLTGALYFKQVERNFSDAI
jgi:lipopolysaccharide transport system permease protein